MLARRDGHHYPSSATAAAKLLQSYPTLCDPIDGGPPGSLVPGILQARTLEWVAIFFSNAWKWKVKVKSLSHVQLWATPWTAAYQAPPPWDFAGKSTGAGCHCLLRWPIFWLCRLFFWNWAAGIVCIFFRLILCQLLHFLLFSPILKAVFST